MRWKKYDNEFKWRKGTFLFYFCSTEIIVYTNFFPIQKIWKLFGSVGLGAPGSFYALR